jgi:hypothetical protein
MKKATKIQGVECTVNANNGTETETEFHPTSSDGPIIGISAVGSQSDADNGMVQLTIEQGSDKPVEKVPVTHLISDDGAPAMLVSNFQSSDKVRITTKPLKDAIGTPVHIIFHFDKDVSRTNKPD